MKALQRMHRLLLSKDCKCKKLIKNLRLKFLSEELACFTWHISSM